MEERRKRGKVRRKKGIGGGRGSARMESVSVRAKSKVEASEGGGGW
jgi:hypothetical protein